ncbi:diaminopimelate decarboxylase [Levilactobacillus brevis]|uniref:diaminopimelate decarboxylase n=1 Tax=Levilactobacillus brevis TaxID=1580 RepID=UPI000B34E435|nr:diaminopimelate decarboxylase [Levilactobacillus brevis]
MTTTVDSTTNHLMIGGMDTVKIAEQFGTPLVAYDTQDIVRQVKAFQQTFANHRIDGVVSYASKAFCVKGIYQLLAPLGVHADVVSAGEMATAFAAGFPSSRLSFHGNNKSVDELTMALDHHLGTIIVDNFVELHLLQRLLQERDENIAIQIRVTPGVSAHTHQYIQTGQVDSKFGFDIGSGQADQALKEALADDHLNVRGVHAHIGSQIFESTGFVMAAEKLIELLTHWHEAFGYSAQVLNLGGGFGIKYVEGDDPQSPEAQLDTVLTTIEARLGNHHLEMPEIWIEPGRSLVGPAGINLYRVGANKRVPSLLPYVAVDGGMGDNIRPALYQAEYEPVLANHVEDSSKETIHIVGKYCESGDILVKEATLPVTKTGDVIALLATGAYGYSMASNYNRNPRPAVIFIDHKQASIVVRRETIRDMLALDEDFKKSAAEAR